MSDSGDVLLKIADKLFERAFDLYKGNIVFTGEDDGNKLRNLRAGIYEDLVEIIRQVVKK